MHGIGFEMPLQDWFDVNIPKTKIASDYIFNCLQEEVSLSTKPTAKIVWLGTMPTIKELVKSKKGRTWEQLELSFHTKTEVYKFTMDKEKGCWLLRILDKLTPQQPAMSFKQVKSEYEIHFEDFELFWFSKPIRGLFKHGLLVL